MALLSEKDAATVKGQFEEKINRPVKLVLHTSETDCMYCAETRQIAEELSALSPYIQLEERLSPIPGDEELGKVPAILVMGEEDGQPKDYGIRFYGIPSGYEFMSLLDAINTVGSGKVSLGEETQKFLDRLEQDVHIQVFVTPTCPYCPQAVILAHHMAFASARVRADMVEASEFPELSAQYQVMGVPRSVINEIVHQEGAVPEAMLLEKIREAMA